VNIAETSALGMILLRILAFSTILAGKNHHPRKATPGAGIGEPPSTGGV
jgi:hypothetical protein